MWTNISGVVGAAIQKVQKIQNEIETQLDHAVGKDQISGEENVTDTGQIQQTAENCVNKGTLQPSVSKNVGKRNIAAPMSRVEEGDFSTIDFSDSPIIEAKSSAAENSARKPTKRTKSKGKVSVSPVSPQDSNHSDPNIGISNIGNIADKVGINVTTSPMTLPEAKETKEWDEVRSQHTVQVQLLEARYQSELQDIKHAAQVDKEEASRSFESRLRTLKIEQARDHEQEIEQIKREFEERIQQLINSSSSDQQNDYITNQSSAELEDCKYRLIKSEERVDSLSKAEQRLLEENNKHQADIQRQQEDHKKLHDDIHKLKEVVIERERALESSNIKLSELHRLMESSQVKLQDLQNEVIEKDKVIKRYQLSNVDDIEFKRQCSKQAEELIEKTAKLAAFENEGQLLAKKQSDMEKTIRKGRNELKDKENEIAKLKESKEQLVKAIEQTQEVLRKHEQDSIYNAKTLQAMQAVSVASTDKISKVEAELSSKAEELQTQRKALETAWADNSELKKLVSELKAEKDDLKKQLGLGTSRVLETESSRRDVEQREAVLRATSKQLEETLRQQMLESNLREERLRLEIQSMQKKWQEAIVSREQLANELTQVTTPLLRQITSLQEQLRIKSDQFIGIESSLNERVLKAENALEMHEHKKALLEEQLHAIKAQLQHVLAQYREGMDKLNLTESDLDKARKLEASHLEEKKLWENKLAYELAQNKSIQTALKELEIKARLELQEAQEQSSASTYQYTVEIAKLRGELNRLQEALKAERFQSKQHKKLSRNASEGNGHGITISHGSSSNAGDGQEGAEDDASKGDAMFSPTLPSKCPWLCGGLC
jgi:hypothetical protein